VHEADFSNAIFRRQAGFQGSQFEGKSRFDGARLEVAPKFGRASASCASEHTWPVGWRTKPPSEANVTMSQVIHEPIRAENAIPRQASSAESPDAQVDGSGDRAPEEESPGRAANGRGGN
jgi:hypothetical protein